jgi:hypothetical protein
MDPLVAVTVTLEDPFGVPEFGGGPVFPPPLPPPHAGIKVTSMSMNVKMSPRWRCFPPTRNRAGRIKPAPTTQALKPPELRCNWFLAVAAAVVTVIDTGVVVAAPLAAIELGLKEHLDSEGSPEQAKVIFPLNALEFVTLNDVVPEPPGAATSTVCCVEGIVA